jgi:hypothetical protein
LSGLGRGDPGVKSHDGNHQLQFTNVKFDVSVDKLELDVLHVGEVCAPNLFVMAMIPAPLFLA